MQPHANLQSARASAQQPIATAEPDSGGKFTTDSPSLLCMRVQHMYNIARNTDDDARRYRQSGTHGCAEHKPRTSGWAPRQVVGHDMHCEPKRFRLACQNLFINVSLRVLSLFGHGVVDGGLESLALLTLTPNAWPDRFEHRRLATIAGLMFVSAWHEGARRLQIRKLGFAKRSGRSRSPLNGGGLGGMLNPRQTKLASFKASPGRILVIDPPLRAHEIMRWGRGRHDPAKSRKADMHYDAWQHAVFKNAC